MNAYELKKMVLKFVKVRDFPVFHCFQCNLSFYSASALLTMQTAAIATADLSVCPSVRHVPVLCPDE